jgi:hypothetical protein
MKRKKILLTVGVIIATVSGVAYYEYNRPAADVKEMSAQPVNAVDLFKQFSSNEQQANTTYLNKALQVSGNVLEVKQNPNGPSQIILDSGDPMFGIACSMDKSQTTVKPGDHVTIKGICTGYLNDVVIIKSLLLN